jgi:tetratricopeptide (TPR) repeat protein
LLRGHGAEDSEERLRAAAAELDGHPLALQLTVGALRDESVDWELQRVSTAQTMLGELSLDGDTESLLETLAALDGPLPGQELADHLSLSPEEFGQAVGEASSYTLVEERGGFLRIHPLIRDFYLRALRRRQDYRDRLADLATRSRDFLLSTSHGSTVRVDSLITSFRLLSWSGRLGEALELHRTLFATLLETAIDLYNERQYPEALHYFEAVIESTEANERAKLYAARTLAYLGRAEEARAMIDEVLEIEPESVEFIRVRGRVEFILRNWGNALDFFERARQRRPNSVAVLRDLGQVNIRLERWEAAREALERAMELREPGAFVRSYYSQVLEHFGELDEARSVIEAAIRVDPDNPGFRHRLGRIAIRQNDTPVARRELERALEIDPNFHEAGISLASLLVDVGETVAARRLVQRVERMPAVRPALLSTIKAKVSLADGECESARRFVYAALGEEREPESLLLALRLEVQCFGRNGDPPDRVRARTEPLFTDLRARGLQREEAEWRARLDDALGDS